MVTLYGPQCEKTCLWDLRPTKAQTRCLISVFVISLFESITSSIATSKISIFYLLAAAEETGLNLAFSETPKAGFMGLVARKKSIWGFRQVRLEPDN